jgi:predicted O-methyltransferase YrrM
MSATHAASEPSLNGPWSIGEEAFAQITRSMSEIAPRVIVEFGSGASSVRLAKAFPDAQVLSLESDPTFFQQSQACARQHGVAAERLSTELRPLTFRRIGRAIYETYSVGPYPAPIDAVLIDGPPHWTRRGREACLYDVAANVRVGGRIYLDDYGRAQERRIVRNWLGCYADALRVTELDAGHGVCVLEKVGPVPGTPRVPLAVAVDSWLVHVRRRIELARAHRKIDG